ncbi:MAG: LPS export ABC transporter periplasmic protein LptC [Rhodospirillaceae bacterium]|nr:LPS export ABC transporter periplasmic protein LptC [Rhodospirillaceae bacterium]
MALNGPIDKLRGDGRAPVVAQPRALFNRRKSRLLWLKILLPLVAIGTAAYLSLWSYRNLTDTRITVEAVTDVPLLDAGMQVSGVAFEGRSKSDRTFSVTALSAMETDGNKDIVNLEEPQAQIELSDTAWIAVTAESGVYDRSRDWVDLIGAVTVYHDNGMTFVTDRAEVNLKTNDASSSVPVTGSDERRQLTAEGFEMIDNGETVLFKGRSHLTILPRGEERDG